MSIISIQLKNGDRVSDKASFASCLIIVLISALAPVLCPGCSDPVPAFVRDEGPGRISTKIHLTSAGVEISGIRSLDMFVFNDDPMQRLDSYQRIEGNSPATAVGASRSGKKILAVLANSPDDRYRWADVNSLQGLAGKLIDLQEEEASHPFMSGLARFEALPSGSLSLDLVPRTARIELRSLRCDFRGRSYEGAPLENIRVYLTNVSSSCPLLADSVRAPFSFINIGRLNEGDMEGFRDPGLVRSVLSRPVGNETVLPGIALYCYAHTEAEADPGRPFTRLVIEGTIQGKTCYYPIEINRGAAAGNPPGILPGRTYRFDLTLTRFGTDDPDGALEPGTIRSTLSVTDWNTQKDSVITF